MFWMDNVRYGCQFDNFRIIVDMALFYKLEGHKFEIRWGEWIFSIYLILLDALGLGVFSAYNRNKYQKQKINVSEE
jgi:hypothetical protein